MSIGWVWAGCSQGWICSKLALQNVPRSTQSRPLFLLHVTGVSNTGWAKCNVSQQHRPSLSNRREEGTGEEVVLDLPKLGMQPLLSGVVGFLYFQEDKWHETTGQETGQQGSHALGPQCFWTFSYRKSWDPRPLTGRVPSLSMGGQSQGHALALGSAECWFSPGPRS